jgi:hypothetical protein
MDVDAVAPEMREHPRDAGAGHLARRRGGGDGGRDAVEDQQRRGQEPAADAEHPESSPTPSPKRTMTAH